MTGNVELADKDENQALLEAISVGEAWLRGLSELERTKLRVLLLQVLLERSRDQAEGGVPPEKIRFTAEELSRALDEFGSGQVTNPGRRIRDLWGRLEKFLSAESETLTELARQTGVRWIPALEKEESYGGKSRPSYYFLAWREAPLDALPDHRETPVPAGGIRYQPRSLRRLPWHLRWLDGLALLQGGGRILSGLLLAGLLWFLFIGVSTLWLLRLLQEAHIQLLFTAAVLIYLPWMVLGPFYRVLALRVIVAPDWWFLLSGDTYQLQYSRPRSGGAEPEERRLHLVAYQGECPRCSGRVEVAGGGLRWWGRLVGKCREAPREHVFSFDHITRVGARLL